MFLMKMSSTVKEIAQDAFSNRKALGVYQFYDTEPGDPSHDGSQPTMVMAVATGGTAAVLIALLDAMGKTLDEMGMVDIQRTLQYVMNPDGTLRSTR